MQRIYLNELESEEPNLGLGVVKLIMEKEQKALSQAKGLIEQAKEELTDEAVREKLIDLIKTIFVYKLPEKSREEIEAMFGLSELKQTKVYQEAKLEGQLEGKLEMIYKLLEEGFKIEEVARISDLPLEIIEKAAKGENN